MTNERLKELRQENNLTQAHIAKQLGIETRNYQRMELLDMIPPVKHLITLADFYNVSVDYILCRTDKREVNR